MILFRDSEFQLHIRIILGAFKKYRCLRFISTNAVNLQGWQLLFKGPPSAQSSAIAEHHTYNYSKLAHHSLILTLVANKVKWSHLLSSSGELEACIHLFVFELIHVDILSLVFTYLFAPLIDFPFKKHTHPFCGRGQLRFFFFFKGCVEETWRCCRFVSWN